MRSLLLLSITTACYSGSNAASDINAAWRGHTRLELAARLGEPAVVTAQPDGTAQLRWRRTGTNIVSLPGGHLDVKVTPASFDVDASAHAGVVDRVEYDVASAIVAPTGTVLQFDSARLAAGYPSGLNLRTGLIFGIHTGLGVVADATSPLPGVGLYMGGMIGPRLALLGSYSFVNGNSDAGAAMGHAWAFGVQHWPTARLAVMAGAAFVLGLEPGLTNAQVSPGGVGAVSFAFLRSGSFVLDARFDATVSTSTAFGMLGVGVNVN